MKPLSGLDATFLYAETPSTPMNVIATVVVEGRIDREALVERIRERLPDLPAFRRRLVEVPLAHPVWIEASDLEVGEHVTRVHVPDPGDDRALEEVVGRLARRRLDRSRPLWHIAVIDRLSEGRAALVVRAHHAAVDGVSGAALLLHLFDRPGGGGADRGVEPVGRAAREPGAAALLGHGIAALAERPRLWRDTLARTARSAAAATRARLTDIGIRDAALPFQAPATPFDGPLSGLRSVGYARTSLASARAVRAAFGGTVNDVILTACTRALRADLLRRGAPTGRPLVAAVPVSTRRLDDAADCGNRISAFLTRLPVQLEDPIHQLSEVARATRSAKQLHAALGPHVLSALAELMDPALARRAFALYARWKLAAAHRPLCNLVVSNVTGPPVPVSLLGQPVTALRPHGPLMEGAGLNVTVLSYAGAVDVGVLACGKRVRDAHRLAARVAEALEELSELALPEVAAPLRAVA